jgi:predicted MPP superfamily phosphohydrolase
VSASPPFPHADPRIPRDARPTPPRFLSRRRVIAAAGAGFTALAAGGIVRESRRLETTRHALGVPAADGRLVRLAQVSDLHMHAFTPFFEQVVARLHDLRPDVILFTGDMFERAAGLSVFETLLAECPRVPSVAILGNWEHWSGVAIDTVRQVYDRHGTELLVNQSIDLVLGERRLRITGLDDFVGGVPNAAAALGMLAPAEHRNHLLLVHCPAARDACPLPDGHRADLVLAGHTHGGQIAPFGFAPVRPPGSGRYVSGWYHDSGPPLYVSRGIGTSFVPVRIGAPPEIALFDWTLG